MHNIYKNICILVYTYMNKEKNKYKYPFIWKQTNDQIEKKIKTKIEYIHKKTKKKYT